MDVLTALPDWIVWCAAGTAALVAVKALAQVIEAVLDMETR